MICPHCQAQLEENTSFCSYCGKSLTPQPTEQPVYQAQPQQPVYQPQQPVYQPQQPVYQAQPQQPMYQAQPQQPVYQPQQPMYQAQPQRPVYQAQPAVNNRNISKKTYLAEHANDTVRRNAKLALIAMLLSLLLIFGSAMCGLSMPMTDTGLGAGFESVVGNSIYDIQQGLKETVESTERSFYYYSSSMSDAEKADAEKMIEKMDALTETFSVINLCVVMDLIADLNETYDMGISEDEMMAMQLLGQVMIWVVVLMLALPTLFVLLGGLTKNTALSVVALVLIVIPLLAVTILPAALVTMAAIVFQIVMCSKVNGAYKKFRAGIPA